MELPRPLPIWVAALGPRAVRLAGEVADGVILNWCTPERVSRARESLVAAAVGAGRDPGDVTVSVYVRAGAGHDGRDALRAAAAEYASYPSYARQFAAMGLEEASSGAAGAEGADALIDAVCLPIDPTAARARIEEYRDAGADLPVVYPVVGAPDASAAADLLAELGPIRP